jgi:hypothetical protein
MARGGARPGAGQPAGKSANTSPPARRARARSTSLPDPVENRHGLPGDPEDTHTRYIEAAIAACLSDAFICRKANPGAGPEI